MNEPIWSRYEAGQYADTPQNWKHLQARKGKFHEIHPGYYAAKDGSTIKRLPNGMLDVRLILCLANSTSCSPWRLKQSLTM